MPTPKVMEAQAIWRIHPRQIASDLRRFFRWRIADWHQGRLSSYELLELFGAVVKDDPDTGEVHPEAVVWAWLGGQLERRPYAALCKGGTRTIHLEFAPEDGAVAKSLREGGYSLIEQMTSETHNEVARLRLSFQIANGGQKYEPFEFVDPRVDKMRADETQQREEFNKEAEEALFEGLDW